MRAVLIALVLALSFPALAQTDSSTRPAPSARTRGGDITKDEYIERARRAAERRFDKMDANHDGVLTADERRAAREERAARRTARSRSDGKGERRYYRRALHRIGAPSMPDDLKTVSRSQSALRVKGLDHVVLRVADMDRAVGFYEQVLGLHIERRLESIGLVQLRAGTAMIDLVPRTEDEDEGRNMDHFAIRIEEMDVPAITAHLKAQGIDPGEVRRRYGAEGYGSSIYITDPDGNTVELKGPPETAG